jgi:hypothetical protein
MIPRGIGGGGGRGGTGLGSAEFVGEEGDSGFGDVGFRGMEGLDKAVGESEATFDKVESAGDAGTEGVGWLRDV